MPPANHKTKPKEANIMEYKVTWTIDIDAESFEDAARQALEIQQDTESIATHFIVQDESGQKREVWAKPEIE